MKNNFSFVNALNGWMDEWTDQFMARWMGGWFIDGEWLIDRLIDKTSRHIKDIWLTNAVLFQMISHLGFSKIWISLPSYLFLWTAWQEMMDWVRNLGL